MATQEGIECRGAKAVAANELDIMPIPTMIRIIPRRNLANPFIRAFYTRDNMVSIVVIGERNF